MNTQPTACSDSATSAADTPTLYLIAHKVRGQPAFDIAERIEIESDEADNDITWIVSTSGHRAYPYWTKPLAEGIDKDELACVLGLTIPSTIPDHYRTAADNRRVDVGQRGRDLLSSLGLLKPSEPIKRRL